MANHQVSKQHRRWAVFISGRGSNLVSVCELRDFFDLGLVVSSSSKALGLQRALRSGVPTMVLRTRPIDWSSLTAELKRHRITHIFLLGFMKILPPQFIDQWRDRILNLHPSLLPLYPGLDSITRAYNDNAALGVSVHMVNEGVDEGEILLQKTTMLEPLSRGVSLEEAELRVHIDEQSLIREVLLRF